MKVCNTVNAVSIVYIHVSHMNSVGVIYDINRFIRESGSYFLIEFSDNRHKLRNNPLKVRNRPFLKCFGKDCVVGICTCICYDFNSLIKSDSFLSEKSDKFRNYHWRMCIVNLDCSIVSKIVKVASLFLALINNIMCRTGNHKVLLINSKNTTCLITVIRIKEKCKVLCNISLIEINRISLNDILINGFNIKKMEFVGSVIVSCNIYVIKSWLNRKISEWYIISHICLCKPALVFNPWIWLFLLEVILKYLLKKSHVIIKSDAVTVKSDWCHRIKETCSESSETAVSQWWFRLNLLYIINALSILLKFLLNAVKHTEIDKIVWKKLSDKEFSWNVINFLLSVIFLFILCKFFGHWKKCKIKFLVGTVLNWFIVFLFTDIC